MADGPREDGIMPPDKQKNCVSPCSENNKLNLKKLNGDLISDKDRVKLSFYVERDVTELKEECKMNSVARKRNICTVDGDSKKDGILTDETDSTKIKDGRKKRCVDRYDSSESSDSGVAVLSSAESGGCGSSDITEPGSPYSPASSSGNSEDSASARMPAWACEPVRSESDARKRHNIELIADRLQPKRPVCSVKNTSTTTTATGVGKGTKTQQGRITEYYNHNKMKPNVAQKRDPSAGSNKDDTKKKAATKATLATDLQKYISFLSQTLDTKVLPETPTAKDALSKNIAPKMNSNGTNKNANTFINLINKIVPHRQDISSDIKSSVCLPKLKEPLKVNNKKNDKTPKRVINGKRPIRRLSLPTGKGLSNSHTCNKQEIAKVNGTVRWPSNSQPLAMKSDVPVCAIQPLTDKNNTLYDPIKMNGVCNNPIQQIPYSNNYNKNPQSQDIQIPICSSIQNQCNNTLSNSSNLSSFLTIPQTVMLTTLRVPQNGSPPQQINANNVNGLNRPLTMGNTMNSPTKLNGQFVFPVMQNINGTVVQIPNMVTKVNQNYVIPNGSHLQPLRQDQNFQPQQTTQMLINGALYKISNSNIQQNYSNIVTKPHATNNMSYPMMPKSFNTAVPTVVVSKQNYGFNVGPSMYMQPSGYIINSMPSVKMCESQATMINTTIQSSIANFNTHNLSEKMSNTSMSSIGLSSSRITIPTEPPDKALILTECATTVASVSTNTEFVSHDELAVIEEYSSTSINLQITNENCNDKNKFENHSTLSELSQKSFDETAKLQGDTRDNRKNDSFEGILSSDNAIKESSDEQNSMSLSEVLAVKDESCEVHNTVLDNAYSNMTNDSESGIGTSVDSPTDSMTSKDGDDDFMSTLSVCVSSVEPEKCQKSPILKKPETIRFPAKITSPKDFKLKHKRDHSASSGTICCWENCKMSFEGDWELLEHLQIVHVNGQAGKENFVCLWDGCKVRGRPSCSRLWLERHALSHGGNKPFKCIFEDCGRRFSTQLLLERHVNNHFNGSATAVSTARKSTESASAKQMRRNGKKMRYRRTPWSARKCDFVDTGVVQGVAWRLRESTSWRLRSSCPLASAPHVLVCQSAVRARRRRGDRTELLVQWTPTGVIDDEWLAEDELVKSREVDIKSLPAPKKVLLYDTFCSSYREQLLQNKAETPTVSGAAKRKQGRQYGGNYFWPSGR